MACLGWLLTRQPTVDTDFGVTMMARDDKLSPDVDEQVTPLAPRSDFDRLLSGLIRGPVFQLWIAVYSDEAHCLQVIATLTASVAAQGLSSLTREIGGDSLQGLLDWAGDDLPHADVLHLVGIEQWRD